MKTFKTSFEKLFNGYADLPQQVLDELFGLLVINTFGRGAHIVWQSKPDTKEYFLFEGIVQEYITCPNGENVTLNFASGPSVVIPHFCRTKNRVSFISIQALTNCTVASVETSELEKFREGCKNYFKASQAMAAHLYEETIMWYAAMKSQPGIEKLALFREAFPGFENYIPHPYIASFLGITEVSLSRLRKLK